MRCRIVCAPPARASVAATPGAGVLGAATPAPGFASQEPPRQVRKLRMRALPLLLITLSGWYWTASTVYTRWRTPMITPDATLEVTTSSSGIEVARAARLWYRVATTPSVGSPRYSPRPSCVMGDTLPCTISPALSTTPP